MPTGGGRSFVLGAGASGAGAVEIGADGAVVAVRHPTRDHSMLLEEDGTPLERSFHDADHRWGKGFVVSSAGSFRWDAPARLDWRPDGVDLSHELGPLRLQVSRTVSDGTWSEGYALTNRSASPVRVGALAVSTPWRDLYLSSADSLRRGVHAHVWPGGADAYAWAAPMDGSGPGLGLVVDSGELWAYSVESRHQVTGSNVRGHLYLHLTDHARNPGAMGGQPALVVDARDDLRWGWRLRWYDDLAALHRDRRPRVRARRLAAEVGHAVALEAGDGVVLSEPGPVRSAETGVRHVDATDASGRTRVSVLFHPPLRDVVLRRVRFVLDRQRGPERAGSRAAAFLPFDNRTGLTVLEAGWPDWSDDRERVGTALMLQEARRRGWGEAAELDAAVAAYADFVREHVVGTDGVVRGDNARGAGPRLYNFPWFARFLLDAGDLDLAGVIMEQYYALGGDHFLAFDLGPVVLDVAGALRASGAEERAGALERRLVDQAQTMLAHGDELPAHEVNYEQSMVAPLVDLLLVARRLDPGAVPAAELLRRLAWLRAFAGDQPDVRLQHVPVRHWDGYWFGALRRWGDTFPHYWSCLSAAAYLAWPGDVGDPGLVGELHEAAYAILRANLASFFPDGSATCAFVYPSCVDGTPAYAPDPLANDQDWALVYAMRHGLGPEPDEQIQGRGARSPS